MTAPPLLGPVTYLDRRALRALTARAYRALAVADRLRASDPVKAEEAFQAHTRFRHAARVLRDRIRRAQKRARKS